REESHSFFTSRRRRFRELCIVYLARIAIRLKPSIQDPQGLAIVHALHELGFSSTESVRMGKYAEVKINAPDKAAAEKAAKDMCEKLLVNSVMEVYDLTVEESR
ncbi:MAG TPA: phosphoribosylformylglycinamidine synthase subunit PurS, partial [Leptospiraceae bacterium]|nr:phosphoribosylformylglycinamidine synthase subunit PurS [Leptospiraceae bacterium]